MDAMTPLSVTGELKQLAYQEHRREWTSMIRVLLQEQRDYEVLWTREMCEVSRTSDD